LKHRVAILLIGCLGLLFIWGLETVTQESETAGQRTGEIFDKVKMQHRWDVLSEGAKGIVYTRVFQNTPRENPLQGLIGAGPGGGVTVPALMNPTEVTLNYLGDIYFTASGRAQVSKGSMIDAPVTLVTAIFSDLGLIGGVVYFFFYGYVVYRIRRQVYQGEYTDRFQAAFAEAFLPSVCMFLLLGLLLDIMAVMVLTFTLWFWAALVWVPISSSDDEVVKTVETVPDSLTSNP